MEEAAAILAKELGTTEEMDTTADVPKKEKKKKKIKVVESDGKY